MTDDDYWVQVAKIMSMEVDMENLERQRNENLARMGINDLRWKNGRVVCITEGEQ